MLKYPIYKGIFWKKDEKLFKKRKIVISTEAQRNGEIFEPSY